MYMYIVYTLPYICQKQNKPSSLIHFFVDGSAVFEELKKKMILSLFYYGCSDSQTFSDKSTLSPIKDQTAIHTFATMKTVNTNFTSSMNYFLETREKMTFINSKFAKLYRMKTFSHPECSKQSCLHDKFFPNVKVIRCSTNLEKHTSLKAFKLTFKFFLKSW